LTYCPAGHDTKDLESASSDALWTVEASAAKKSNIIAALMDREMLADTYPTRGGRGRR
jgi:hypothetical protein